MYVESYSKGKSAQYIDHSELNRYLSDILQSGTAIICAENEVLKACLLYAPLSFDKFLPESIVSHFKIEKCVYIAEVMVAETFRGQGLGNAIIKDFFEIVDSQNYTDVFIRVWDGNLPALNLYEKMGFTKCATIEQHKKTPDGKTDFVMRKMYLHKPL